VKILTFLGAGTAYITTYVMPDGREHTAPFFGVALARFYPDADIRVFVTQGARQAHWGDFLRQAEDYADYITPVDLSDGENEEQLWQIFEAVVENVGDGEEVLFDITHGFRSLPFLSFLAAAYLRVVKNIELQGVLYGNFEARDRSVEPHRAPVLDMTRFVGLLDWMIAADRFTRFGDARDLAERLRAATSRHYPANPKAGRQAKGIRLAANAMDEVSLALRLIRPAETMTAIETLQSRLADGVEAIHNYARPFRPLAQQVTDTYAPLAMGSKAQMQNPVGALARERRMVSWYLERRQYVQAMAIAREWIISWALLQLGFDDVLEKDMREEVEKAIGRANAQRREQHGAFGNRYFETRKSLNDIPQIARALKLYEEIGSARNDLLHAGKRPSAMKAGAMERKIKELCDALQSLPLP